jgi:hypothetical protein
MFSLKLCPPFLKLIYDTVEILQVFLIFAHQVSGAFQEFFRGWIAECHVGWQYTPLAAKVPV